jgi:class 3 adenylate cyclase
MTREQLPVTPSKSRSRRQINDREPARTPRTTRSVHGPFDFTSLSGAVDGASARLAEPQRRQVVLFADICGFTELSHALDTEETRRVVEHGGSIDKHLGDATIALAAPPGHGSGRRLENF